MREIIFRGKRLDNGEWVYGYLTYNEWHGTHKIDAGKYAVLSQPINPETIGQFTGLLDKNGKKIFEGDLLRICDNDNGYLEESEFIMVSGFVDASPYILIEHLISL